MDQAVTDIIVARSRYGDGLSRMVVWSIAAHVAVVVTLLVVQKTRPEPPPRTVMTISLGGAVGPKTGGLTQIGGRPVQAPEPQEPVRRAETAPAPTPPPMTLPDPKPRPLQAKPQTAPREATGRTPTTGPEPQEGSARADTQNRGQGFGLSSAGGGGGGVRTDVSNFCCPEYILEMTSRVKRNWNERMGVVGVTTMRFTIQRDGTITDIQRDKSSGFEVLDTQSDRALRLTAKLPPLPTQFTNPTLTIYMEFAYQR